MWALTKNYQYPALLHIDINSDVKTKQCQKFLEEMKDLGWNNHINKTWTR